MLHVAVVRFPLTTMQNVRQISSAFRVPKLIKIGPFLTEFFNKNSHFFDPVANRKHTQCREYKIRKKTT